MRKRQVKIQLLEGAKMPEYATENSFGADVFANISDDWRLIQPGERMLVTTGIKIALPDDCECAVRPKSGLALKYGVTVLNTPGTVDADYRGEVGVILINLGQDDFIVKKGMKIAQICFNGMNGIFQAEFVPGNVDEDETERGEGGFGHTGL